MGWFTTFLLSLLWYVQALKPSSVAWLEGKTLHCSLKQLHKPAFVLIGLPFGTRSHVTNVFWLWEICRKHLGKISDSFIFFSSLRAARRRRRIMKLPISSEYFLKCLIYNLPLFLADLPGNSLRNAHSWTQESAVDTCVETYFRRKLNGRNILNGCTSDLISFLPCGVSLITKHIITLWN